MKNESAGALLLTTDGEVMAAAMCPEAVAITGSTGPSWLKAVMFHSPNIRATAVCLLSSAIIMGDRSMLSTMFLLAKHSRRSLTASMCPSLAAKNSGLCPCRVVEEIKGDECAILVTHLLILYVFVGIALDKQSDSIHIVNRGGPMQCCLSYMGKKS